MNFAFYIAKKYAFTLSKNSAINTITFIASFGIIAGSMALFVVLSVFSGLRSYSVSFSNSTDPDLKIFATKGKSFYIDKSQVLRLQKNDFITSFTFVVEDKAFFVFGEKEHVGYLKGIDKNYTQVIPFEDKIYQGIWLNHPSKEVVVGSEIARKMGMGLLDFYTPLEVYVPKPGEGTIDSQDAFVTETIQPVGFFNISEDVDNKYIYCDISLAQYLLNYKINEITAIECKLSPNASEKETLLFLQDVFKNKVTIKNRIQLNDALYKMLNTENIVLYLIFTLVLIIALFTLIGAIIMMIIDKKHNLKTLLNLGVEWKSLRKIFLFQGFIISVFGGSIGLISGILVVYLQQKYQWIMLSETLAYPVEIESKNMFIVFTTITILGFLASWYASRTIKEKFLNS